MKTVAVMATFPGRGKVLSEAVRSISRQVDVLYLVLNEFNKGGLGVPSLPANVEKIFPPEDLKDTGKFYAAIEPTDYVLLCDDDIVYPENYAQILRSKYEAFAHLNPVVGVHGVNYVDFFDGDPASRVVYVFTQALRKDCFVNQLGTGTVLCKGAQLPPFEFMKSSARFVDLRFARHCQESGFARICISREKGWMQELKTEGSIFQSFTTVWAPAIVREAQSIAGFRYLPQRHLLAEEHPSAPLPKGEAL